MMIFLNSRNPRYVHNKGIKKLTEFQGPNGKKEPISEIHILGDEFH